MKDHQHDVVIIGGGHNGLVCAFYLAKAGLDVLVLEKHHTVGGAAVTEEFHPGFRNSVASYAVSLLNPKVIADLDLTSHGLRIVERRMANFWPIDATRGLTFPYGMANRQRAIHEFSPRDANRYPDYDAALERAAAVLRELVLQTPPNGGDGLREMLRVAGSGKRLLGLSLADKRLVTDIFTKSAADFLDLWFESDIVKGAIAFDGIVGAYASPHTPGTAYVLLHHCFGAVNGKSGVWGHAIGGMGAIAAAMRTAAERAGAVIRTSTPVTELTYSDRKENWNTVTGVRLANGESLKARVVAANVPPKLLFRDIVPEDMFADPELHRRLAAPKSGSATFRMNVALSELPDFTCRPGKDLQDHHTSGIVMGPSIEYLDRAYLDARAHGWSRQPVIEMLIPSTLDDTLAPPGQHVASLFVQHAAPQLPDGRSWEDARDTFADVVIDTVNAHAPNFRASILGRQVLSPLDLERRFSLPDGDIFHGQLGLDQLFSLRPLLGFANYRMPLPGLYLCGSGAHPGGGVTGVPGHNAAREIIRDLRGPFARVWARWQS